VIGPRWRVVGKLLAPLAPPATRLSGGDCECTAVAESALMARNGRPPIARVRFTSYSVRMRSTTTRALRENLRATMARAARGEEVLVTRRGKPYVRIVSAAQPRACEGRYPLRGSVVRVAADFDAPLDRLWKALDG
jgi:prevent-host-death family protein